MVSTSKRWPNHAEWARMDALAASNRILGNLSLMKSNVHDPNVLRYILDCVEDCYKIKIALMQAREMEDGDE